MPNDKGWCTKEEVLETGLPYYIPRSERWTHEPYPFAVLLTRTRCKEFGIPALRNGSEWPSAFRYASAAGTGTNDDKKNRYIPLYDRTDVFESGEISMDELYKHEIMGVRPPSLKECSECERSIKVSDVRVVLCKDCGEKIKRRERKELLT